MIPCCPCVSLRRNQGRLTESLNEGTHLFLRQNAVESPCKVAHGSLLLLVPHAVVALGFQGVEIESDCLARKEPTRESGFLDTS